MSRQKHSAETRDEIYIQYLYGMESPSLASTFHLLRRWKDAQDIDDCAICMQKYPTLESKKVKTNKTDNDGNPIFRDKITESGNDTRWVLSFDWKTHDPAEARSLSYDFYDHGWPGSVTFLALHDNMIIDKKTGELVARTSADDLSENVAAGQETRSDRRFFQCVLSLSNHDEKHAETLKKSFERIFADSIRILPEHLIGAFERNDDEA